MPWRGEYRPVKMLATHGVVVTDPAIICVAWTPPEASALNRGVRTRWARSLR